MTEFKINTADDGKQTIKIPLALIGPIWGIVFAVVSGGFTVYKAQRDQQEVVAIMAKDIQTLKTNVATLSQNVGVYSDAAYTVADAARDQAPVGKELADHEARLRALERRRR